jgi:predicted amidophosphoribosyltransferase
VCEACWASIRHTSAIEIRFDATHAIGWAAAVDAYDGRMKDIIHALKYDRRHSISPRLGALMRESGATLLRGADCVVPVPLHPRREYSRGFNQAHDLAMHLGLPVLPILRRVVHTPSQIDLPKHERHKNVQDAFAFQPACPEREWGRRAPGSRLSAYAAARPLRRDLAEARFASEGGPAPGLVVLIDDVATTGATLEQCAIVLKRSGVREVRALTAARVVTARR